MHAQHTSYLDFASFFLESIAFFTSRLASIAAEEILADNDPLGSGSPSKGLKYW